MTKKVLIANRGEISIRIARACREVGLVPVAIYSEADRDAPHALSVEEAYCVGPAASRESYLSIPRVLEAAKAAGAHFVHPGFGFLSENPAFARAVESSGITFIGPTADAIEAMGSKALARQRVSQAGVPCVPGYDGDDQSEERLILEALRMGFPVLVKPADGGGGKGMIVVEDKHTLHDAIAAAKRVAMSSFGSDRLILERYLRKPRHIEIQVFGDAHGNVAHLFERECSIQRRHQKIIEETPSVALTEPLRERMCQAAIAAAKSVNYRSAGTVEFLLDEDGSFYFLEMNTRLQVEHPITEWITGIDIVSLQLQLARGEPIHIEQSNITRRGHAIEARVYAEDAAQGFLPSAGTILHCKEPSGPFVRVDSGIWPGYEVPTDYDPMLSKVSVYGSNRHQAIERLLRALREYEIVGITTNLSYLCAIVEHYEFRRGDTYTSFLREHLHEYQDPKPSDDVLIAAAAYEKLVPSIGPISSEKTGKQGDPYSPWRPGVLPSYKG